MRISLSGGLASDLRAKIRQRLIIGLAPMGLRKRVRGLERDILKRPKWAKMGPNGVK